MQHVKALKSHVYAGKRRNTGDVYQIRKSDKVLFQRLGMVAFVEAPEQPLQNYYFTTSIPESPKKKRGRPKKVKTDDA